MRYGSSINSAFRWKISIYPALRRYNTASVLVLPTTRPGPPQEHLGLLGQFFMYVFLIRTKATASEVLCAD